MSDAKSQSKRPDDSDFKQQRLPAWQPLLTPRWVILTFAIVGVVFLPIGVVILSESNSVVEVRQRYDDLCPVDVSGSGSMPCNVTLTIPERMEPPIFFYYELSNFYQNHRRYVMSRSDAQLRGDLGDVDGCDPLETAGGNVLVPCGLIANSFFNDTFEATLCPSGSACPSGGTLLTGNSFSGSGISWRSDREDKFRFVPVPDTGGFTNVTADGVQLPRVDNEDFIVWMRTAGLPTFKKLKRRINDITLEAGEQLFVDIGNFYPVFQFDGEKSIVLSTTSWLGGKNEFLGWAYITVGSLCLLLALLFELKHNISPRQLGDMQYFHWSGASKQADDGSLH